MKALNRIKNQIMKSEVLLSLIALLLSLLVSSVVIVIAGYSPFEAYGAMLDGAFISEQMGAADRGHGDSADFLRPGHGDCR